MPPMIMTSTDNTMPPEGAFDDGHQKVDPSAVGYQSPSEIKASKLKVIWTDIMAQGKWSKAPTYKQVAVLLLCWEKDSSDMETEAEIAELEETFKSKFRYQTEVARLDATNPNANVQMQVNAQVAGFAMKHDGPDNLLIVYYAGHGTSHDVHGLVLLGQRSPNDRIDPEKLEKNRIVWTKTEDLLKEAQADVLEIFDCCYGGALAVRGDDRLFEYLAATGIKGWTAVPGPNSFTKALIFALEHLVQKKEGRFTTVDLLRTIRSYEHFPRAQEPVLSDRKYPLNKAGRIMLHPLRPGNGDAEKALDTVGPHAVGNGQSMTLHFDFSEDVGESHLKILGKTLTGMFERNTLGVYRVRWGGLEDTMVVRAVNLFRGGLERRRSTASRLEKPNINAAEIREFIKSKTPNPSLLAIGASFVDRPEPLSLGALPSPLASSPRTSDFGHDLRSTHVSAGQVEYQQKRKRSDEHPGKGSKGED
ncbi:MAG: hypothetical protein Q9207_008010 [Kuettlingeria erythrocarpa]